MRAQEVERVDARREARRAVVGKHPLPRCLRRELRRLDRRVERKRELALLSARAGDALRARHETELPKQVAPRRAERVARAGRDQRLERRLRHRHPLREVAHAGERPAAVALGDDRVRVVLSHRRDVVEPDPDTAVLELARRAAQVHVRRGHVHPALLRVADEARGRVEAHRLLVQKRAQELGRVMMAQPRRLVREQPERGRVRLREAEAREADHLVVDPVGELRVDALPLGAGDESLAKRLDRGLAPLAAHRPAQALRLLDAEARERHGHLEHLLLEDDHAERVAEGLREQRVLDRRDERRILAEQLPVLDVRVDGLALDRPGPDERDLHG